MGQLVRKADGCITELKRLMIKEWGNPHDKAAQYFGSLDVWVIPNGEDEICVHVRDRYGIEVFMGNTDIEFYHSWKDITHLVS